jgi:transketolase
MRCLEQIRNDIAYHHLPVTVVSVGAGFAYGNLGYSHHAVQDIGILRTLPEMTVLSPADPGEAREGLQWLVENPCPSYLRLGKAGEPELHAVRGLAQAPLKIIEGGSEVALVATGSILKEALAAAKILAAENLSVSVFSCPLLQPVSPDFFAPLKKYSRLVALEEHVPAGGLASLLREYLKPPVHSLALPPKSFGLVGSQDFLRRHAGLDATSVAAAIRQVLTSIDG